MVVERAPRRFGPIGGWVPTLLGLLPVAGILVAAFLWTSPGVSPAPSAYREAACQAVDELTAGVTDLERAVSLARDRSREVTRVARDARAASAAAVATLAAAPVWQPGERLNSQVAVVARHLGDGARLMAGEEGIVWELADEASESADLARQRLGEVEAVLAAGDYGFSCP